MLPIPFNNPQTYRGHSGVDFPQNGGTIIPASGPGVVSDLTYNDKGGYWTWVLYDGYDLEVGYAHQNSGAGRPSIGTRVSEGSQLGYVGSLGTNSTGNHLHLEVLGDATTSGVWRMFTDSRVVSGGRPSGGTTDGPLVVDGGLGPATVRALQKALGVSIDGDWGYNTTLALQKKLSSMGHKLNLDGDLGSATIKAMQTFLLGAKRADGVMGYETIKGLQSYLRGGGKFNPVTKPSTPSTPAVPDNGQLTLDGSLGPATVKKLQAVLGLSQDGAWGPGTTKTLQTKLAAMGHKITIDGEMGPATIRALQTFLLGAAKADGQFGPASVKGLQHYLNVGGRFNPPTATKPKDDEAGTISPDPPSVATSIRTPTASEFPSWIRYDEKLDPEGTRDEINKDAETYYGQPYSPIESHTHWWDSPDAGATHDGTISHLLNSKDLSVNYVVSDGRVTLMVPLDTLAYTTGKRNPFGWKSENDPKLTESQYKTMGYLHYIVEKLNPSLLNEPIRLHKEFVSTSCSNIDPKKVRFYADQFRTGALDPKTGKAPGNVGSDMVQIPKALIAGLPKELRALADDLDKYLK